VDKESKKITLGVKQLSSNPWESIERSLPIGSIVHGTVTKTAAFGAFVQLDNGIEALIHVTELSDQPFGKVEDVVSKGDRVTAKVIKVDPEHKKLALSIKEYLIEKNQMNHDDIVISGKGGKKSKKKSDVKKSKDREDEESDE
jgi:small subunit ribosomal protein S1